MSRQKRRAILLAALCARVARWERFHAGDDPAGELSVGGLRYCTRLDDDGCPIVHDAILEALRQALDTRQPAGTTDHRSHQCPPRNAN